MNDRDRVGRTDLPRRLIGAPVETGLHQQDAPCGIFGETGSHGGTGRTAADNDHIMHQSSLPGSAGKRP